MRKAVITPPDQIRVVPKPWGEERWLAHTDRYAGKVLILKRGHRLSLQYHERKHEVQFIDSGRIRYTLGSVDEPGKHEEVIVEALNEISLEEEGDTPRKVHRVSKRPRASKEGDVTTSMPGTIVDVLVNDGDHVDAGSPVLVTEAMKMETEIQAPVSGTVSAIHVQKGDSVNPDEALIEIDPG